MLKAIVVALVVLVCSILFVAFQMPTHRARQAPPPKPAAVLDVRDDGSVYAVGLEVSQLRKRVEDSEKRTVDFQKEIAGLRKERDDLEGRVDDLKKELERVRKEIPPANAPAAGNTPAPAPAPGPGPGPGPGPDPGPTGRPAGTQ